MVKTYKRGQDLKTDEFSTMEDTKKHPTKVVAEAGKIGQSATSKGKRTIKTAPKNGSISRTSIKKAVIAVSSSRRKE